jgi:hypothetical protein
MWCDELKKRASFLHSKLSFPVRHISVGQLPHEGALGTLIQEQ